MRAATYRRRLAISALEENLGRLSRQLVDPPSSLRYRALLQSKTTWAEANSFPCGCQPFCCIPIGSFRVSGALVRLVSVVTPTPSVTGMENLAPGPRGSVATSQV